MFKGSFLIIVLIGVFVGNPAYSEPSMAGPICYRLNEIVTLNTLQALSDGFGEGDQNFGSFVEETAYPANSCSFAEDFPLSYRFSLEPFSYDSLFVGSRDWEAWMEEESYYYLLYKASPDYDSLRDPLKATFGSARILLIPLNGLFDSQSRPLSSEQRAVYLGFGSNNGFETLGPSCVLPKECHEYDRTYDAVVGPPAPMPLPEPYN